MYNNQVTLRVHLDQSPSLTDTFRSNLFLQERTESSRTIEIQLRFNAP